MSPAFRDLGLHTFKHALRTQDFTLTAELALNASTDRAGLLQQARALAPFVDALQVPESVEQEVHLAPLAAAAILIAEGIDPVVHMHCRDRNRIALLADLLGARALGVSSLLVMRGKEIATGVDVRQVYDWGAKKLIAAANSMEDAEFLIGSVATIFKPDRDWKPEHLPTKADAGVRFVQTQVCFDIDLLRHYMARLVAERLIQRINVIVGLAPLPSADLAQWLGKNLRGSVVPAKVVKRLREAADPEREGVELCAELLSEMTAIPGVSGANLLCLGNPDAVTEVIRLAGIPTGNSLDKD